MLQVLLSAELYYNYMCTRVSDLLHWHIPVDSVPMYTVDSSHYYFT